MKCKCKKDLNDGYYKISWYDYESDKDKEIKLCRSCYSYLEYYNKLNVKVEYNDKI